jgi:Flp pilus assembly protein TadG
MIMRKFMRRVLIRAFRCEEGGPLVETALTLPVLITLLLGAVELARVAYTSIECTNAARAGASYGMQSATTESDTTGIQTVAASDAAEIAGGLSTTVATSGICSDGTACTGAGNSCQNTDCSTSQIETILTVTTTATVSPMVRIPGLPSTYTVHGTAVQKVLKN